MQFQGTPFEDYVLDEFIKVQLLFDDSYKYVKVSQISGIPTTPTLSSNSKSLFHKSSTLMKHLMELLNELSNVREIALSTEFKNNVTKFYSLHKTDFRNFTTESLISSFQEYLTKAKHIQNLDPQYYIQSIQLIDLMLLCKSSSSEKSTLMNIRTALMNCSYLQLPTISDEKQKSAICSAFNIPAEILMEKIATLSPVISKSQVVDFFQSGNVLSNTYTEDDFENRDYYQNWLVKSRSLEEDMMNLFTDAALPPSKLKGNIVPNQFNDTISLLIAISLNSTSTFFQGLIKCMQLWQVNPFYIQSKFVETAVELSKSNNGGKISPELVEKAFNLSYLAMPFQVQFLEWPLNEKKASLALSLKIYNESVETIRPCFSMFFQDQESFTVVLSFLKLLKLNLKNVKMEIRDRLAKAIDERLASHKSKAGILDSGKGIKLPAMVKFLSWVSRDVNMLYNWKFANKDLNLSFQIFELGSKILMTPTLEYIKGFIFDIKSSGFSLVSDKDNRSNFGSFIDLVNNLKTRTNFKYDFQNDIFEDFYKIVQSWDIEMINKTKVILANDDMTRMDGCSFSASIQNLILLLEGYIKLLDSFKWNDEYQSSELSILLYKNIVHSVKYYHHAMLQKLDKMNSVKDVEKKVDLFVCLNNIHKLSEFLEGLEKDENVLRISQYLVTSGKSKANTQKNANKYISFLIKNAENIEDTKGNPLDLKVRLGGLINNETRIISKDYNPDWHEEFNALVSAKSSSTSGMIKIELLDPASGSIYKSINYNVKLNAESLFKNQNEKILLKPKSGSLNINVTVEFEKNDPLFYILNCKKEVDNSVKRSINYFIESNLADIKSVFSLAYLQRSIIESPIRSENDYKKLQDPVIDKLVGDFQVKILPQAYNNLETKLFDQMVVELWCKILNIAQNLLLPRLSMINYMISNKLSRNKARNSIADSSLASAPGGNFNHTTSRHQIHETTREELIRVVEWCFKFRAMLDIPDMILQDGLETAFKEFNEMKELFQKSLGGLWQLYYADWRYLSHNMMFRLSKGAAYDRSRWIDTSKRKILVLRIILAKSREQLAKVKAALEAEQRFERVVKTEIEVMYLQQFL